MEIDVGLDAVGLRFEVEAQVAVEAARLGYGRLWTGSIGDPFQTCALRWAETRGVVAGGIGTAIGVLPVGVRTPADVAMSAAALSRATGGRFVLGIGAGSTYESAYRETWGIEERSPLALMRAYLTTIRAFLAGESVTSQGAGVRYHQARLAAEAAPTPIYLGVVGPEMARLGGELADGVYLSWCTADQVTLMRQRVAEGADQAQRAPSDVTVAASVRVCIDDDDEIAKRGLADALLPYVLGWGGPPPRPFRASFERMGFGPELAGSTRCAPGTSLGSRSLKPSRSACYAGSVTSVVPPARPTRSDNRSRALTSRSCASCPHVRASRPFAPSSTHADRPADARASDNSGTRRPSSGPRRGWRRLDGGACQRSRAVKTRRCGVDFMHVRIRGGRGGQTDEIERTLQRAQWFLHADERLARRFVGSGTCELLGGGHQRGQSTRIRGGDRRQATRSQSDQMCRDLVRLVQHRRCPIRPLSRPSRPPHQQHDPDDDRGDQHQPDDPGPPRGVAAGTGRGGGRWLRLRCRAGGGCPRRYHTDGRSRGRGSSCAWLARGRRLGRYDLAR